MRRFGERLGMTLIELLAVILIIGILAGVLMPAVQKARQKSREVKAFAEVKELKNAWRSYVSTYMNDEDVPNLPSGGPMDASMVKILIGETAAMNPDKIKFLDVPVNARDAGFLDPWQRPYQVSIGALTAKTKTWSYATRVYPANRNPLE